MVTKSQCQLELESELYFLHEYKSELLNIEYDYFNIKDGYSACLDCPKYNYGENYNYYGYCKTCDMTKDEDIGKNIKEVKKKLSNRMTELIKDIRESKKEIKIIIKKMRECKN